MSSKAFNITMPEELVQQLDKHAKMRYASRSDYIREAVLEKMQKDDSVSHNHQVDEVADSLIRTYDEALKNLSQR